MSSDIIACAISMLKRYKNALFQATQVAGLDVVDFTADDTATAFFVNYYRAGLKFMVNPHDENPHEFDYSLTPYTGAEPNAGWLGPYPEEGTIAFEQVLAAFKRWLEQDIRLAIEEELIPDLWVTASESGLAPDGQPEQQSSEFEPSEREQLKAAITTFHVLLESTFHPTDDQAAFISMRLDYLTEAVDRLNRFDWKSVAISTLITISVALSLDTERGRVLYGLFQQALAAVWHLLK